MKGIRILLLVMFPLILTSCATKQVAMEQTVQGADKQYSFDQMAVDVSWCYNKVELSELYDLGYNIGFYGLGSGKMKPLRNENFRADVINKQTNDSTKVEIIDLTYSLLTRKPLTYAFTFCVEYGGHRYLIHGMHDIRARYDKTQVPLTTGCYMIK